MFYVFLLDYALLLSTVINSDSFFTGAQIDIRTISIEYVFTLSFTYASTLHRFKNILVF